MTVGEGDGAVVERYETTVGDGNPEDIGGEVGEGGAAIGTGLRVDVPREVPDLWVDVIEQAGLSHVFFEDGSVDGREGFDGDKEGGSGGKPGGAVLGEATTWDDVVDVGVVLELSAPGMQDPGETRELCPDKTLVFGKAFEG